MSTIEATVSMMETMPQEAQEAVFTYAKNIYSSMNTASPFKPVSEEQLLSDLAISRKEFAEGKGLDATEAVMEIRRAHGFI
jgi:hypothetical protein